MIEKSLSHHNSSRDLEIDKISMIQTTVDETFIDTSEALKMCFNHFKSDFDELEYISELNELLEPEAYVI